MRKKLLAVVLLATALCCAGAAWAANFSIQRWFSEKNEWIGGLKYTMYITNNTSREYDFASFIVTFYDSADRVIARDDPLPIQHFLPGTTRKIEGFLDDESLRLHSASVRLDDRWSH